MFMKSICKEKKDFLMEKLFHHLL